MDDHLYGHGQYNGEWAERDPDYVLEIRQEPRHARVATGQDLGDRKPIDPPPILQLHVSPREDPMQNFLQSPYFFVACSLLRDDDPDPRRPSLSSPSSSSSSSSSPPSLLPPPPRPATALAGTAVSSLHRLKDADGIDGAFFVFGDLRCKAEGRFRLVFSLYERVPAAADGYAYVFRTAVRSAVFVVHAPRHFPGLAPSTSLTRAFCEQGVRLRLRLRRDKDGREQGAAGRRRSRPAWTWQARERTSPRMAEDGEEEAEEDDDEEADAAAAAAAAAQAEAAAAASVVAKRRRVLAGDDIDGPPPLLRSMPRAAYTAAYADAVYGGLPTATTATTTPMAPALTPFVPSQQAAYAASSYTAYDAYSAYSHYAPVLGDAGPGPGPGVGPGVDPGPAAAGYDTHCGPPGLTGLLDDGLGLGLGLGLGGMAFGMDHDGADGVLGWGSSQGDAYSVN